MTPEVLGKLLLAQRAGKATVLATRLDDGLQVLLPDDQAPLQMQQAADAALAQAKSTIVALEGNRWFLHVEAPPCRLLVVGAVHIAQALARLALVIGLPVTVIDPRRSFASEERFPGVDLLHEWPDEALHTLKLDRHTAVVVLTHDPKLDDPALEVALRSDCFFIGALGSRKSHAKRLDRLAALGHSAASLARISGPVGLSIGAVGPAEIALSTLAEIVAVMRGVTRGPR